MKDVNSQNKFRINLERLDIVEILEESDIMDKKYQLCKFFLEFSYDKIFLVMAR